MRNGVFLLLLVTVIETYEDLFQLGVRISKDRIVELREAYTKWAAKHNKEDAKGLQSLEDSDASNSPRHHKKGKRLLLFQK